MFEWIKEKMDKYQKARDAELAKELSLAKELFVQDVNTFLKSTNKSLEMLTETEKVFLIEMGATMYFGGHNGITEGYFGKCFEEEIGRFSGYKPPQNPIQFMRQSRLKELGIIDIEKQGFYPERAIKLSEEFKDKVYDPILRIRPKRTET